MPQLLIFWWNNDNPQEGAPCIWPHLSLNLVSLKTELQLITVALIVTYVANQTRVNWRGPQYQASLQCLSLAVWVSHCKQQTSTVEAQNKTRITTRGINQVLHDYCMSIRRSGLKWCVTLTLLGFSIPRSWLLKTRTQYTELQMIFYTPAVSLAVVFNNDCPRGVAL